MLPYCTGYPLPFNAFPAVDRQPQQPAAKEEERTRFRDRRSRWARLGGPLFEPVVCACELRPDVDVVTRIGREGRCLEEQVEVLPGPLPEAVVDAERVVAQLCRR